MVMPTLIGGFLRHGRIIWLVVLILTNFVSDSIILLHESLNTEGSSNEVISEGCVKWGKGLKVMVKN